jgi:hypothetical protein
VRLGLRARRRRFGAQLLHERGRLLRAAAARRGGRLRSARRRAVGGGGRRGGGGAATASAAAAPQGAVQLSVRERERLVARAEFLELPLFRAVRDAQRAVLLLELVPSRCA